MCGIAGYSNKKLKSNELEKNFKRNLEMLHHRGPDSKGHFLDKENNFLMGMTRLSILDLENGHQPFFSNDQRYAIIFNGEIVNSKSLRSDLENKNISFRSKNSDTEVLLNLLILEGVECLQKLNGMFSFCFYDLKKKEAILARDRFGIKPLYFFSNSFSFGFSSELKNLINLYPGELKIDNQSVYDYLSLMYIPSPKTIFQNIEKLSQGELIEINLNNLIIKKKRWFKPEFKPDSKMSIKDAIFGIQEISKKAIKEWSLSDVPICNSLSGGLDSSTISALLKNQNINVTNFTLGFKSESDIRYDEIEIAKKVSNFFDQKHQIIKISSDDFIDSLDRLMDDIHEPYGGGLPSWMVYKKISKDYKVAFNGIGVDEFFGNYSKWKNLDSFWKRKITYEKFCNNFFNIRYYSSDIEKNKIVNFSTSEIIPTSLTFFNKFQENDGDIRDKSALLDINTQLSDEFLSICDVFSMSFSLEVRPFYLDNNLTNYFFSIPSDIRVGSHKDLKSTFKKSFEKILPKEILSGSKQGFILPIENWLKNDLKQLTNKFFSKKKINEHGLLDFKETSKLLDSFSKRPKLLSRFDKFHKLQTLIWAILVFQLWFEKNINKKEIII
jgi:asparagine synthase (glutamine-hydrolysing)